MLLALLTSATPAAAQQAPTPFSQLDGFHRLDFWLGDWQVHSGESLVGTSSERFDAIYSRPRPGANAGAG